MFGDDLGGVAGADDRGHTKVAADDGGMAGGTAVVGHDARSPLHDGNPVGIRRLGYENRSIAELFDVGGGADHTGLAGGDGSTDGGAGRDCGAFRFQAVMQEGGGAGLDRKSTSLNSSH